MIMKDKDKKVLEKFRHDHTVAVRKPCPNKGKPCFCDGTCQEIIGYRELDPLEKRYE